MKKSHLIKEIFTKKSFLCIGLDSDIQKIPSFLLKFDDPVFEFNKQIVDATHDKAVAYKPNTAFYEAQGAKGWATLKKTALYIKEKYPEIFLIADAKRGDIGNTSAMYAKTFFENMPFDAVTLSPYMGRDVVYPFFAYKEKWVILLALTSNKSAEDFQFLKSPEYLFENVIKISRNWENAGRIMYVVGATQTEMLQKVRQIIPDHFLLVPGIGVQGGSLKTVIENGKNKVGGMLINSSRGIIFADNSRNFAEKAREKAELLQQEMEKYFAN